MICNKFRISLLFGAWLNSRKIFLFLKGEIFSNYEKYIALSKDAPEKCEVSIDFLKKYKKKD